MQPEESKSMPSAPAVPYYKERTGNITEALWLLGPNDPDVNMNILADKVQGLRINGVYWIEEW